MAELIVTLGAGFVLSRLAQYYTRSPGRPKPIVPQLADRTQAGVALDRLWGVQVIGRPRHRLSV